MTNLLLIDTVSIKQFQQAGLFEPFTAACSGLGCTSTVCTDITFSPPVVTKERPTPGMLYIETPDDEGISDAFRLCYKTQSLSFEDATVLVMAARYGLTLLTNDTCVRNTALSLHIEVADYLWAIIYMVKAGALDLVQAPLTYYQLMLPHNRSLTRPQAETVVYTQYGKQSCPTPDSFLK